MTNADKIRINRSNHQSTAESTVTVYCFVDKDTNQYIRFIPSLDISSYGSTASKAEEMLKVSLHEELLRLLAMSDKQAKLYLVEFGWKVDGLRNKNLSHVVVDKLGALQGFNVDLDSVIEEKISSSEKLEIA